jgi:hypothetical protein
MGMSRMGANLCGWFSLLCGLPLLMLVLMGAGLRYPFWILLVLIAWTFWGPLAGSLLASAAAKANRWWLVLAAVWLTVLISSFWYWSNHPIDF